MILAGCRRNFARLNRLSHPLEGIFQISSRPLRVELK